MSFTARKGLHFETRARSFLEAQGLTWLESNFRCRLGEIDLIMSEDQCVCFIEVRYRRSKGYGGAGASITRSKQLKIIRAAQVYLSQHRSLQNRALRFDALLFEPDFDGEMTCHWIKNAFYAE